MGMKGMKGMKGEVKAVAAEVTFATSPQLGCCERVLPLLNGVMTSQKVYEPDLISFLFSFVLQLLVVMF